MPPKPPADALCHHCGKPSGKTWLFEFAVVEYSTGGQLFSRNEYMHTRCLMKFLAANPYSLIGLPSD